MFSYQITNEKIGKVIPDNELLLSYDNRNNDTSLTICNSI